MKKIALLAVAGLAASAANAQLIVAFDDTAAGVTTAYEIRVSDGSNTATPLFSDIDVWGMASDNDNEILYINSGTQLYSWDGTGTPTLVADITINGGISSVVSLAFDEGTLYATRNIGGDGSPTAEGVYTINTITGEATLILDYASASYDFGGFDSDGGRFWGTNDDATPFGSGLFEIELNGTITFVASYPAGRTDIDGLAIGGGRAYLVEDEPGATIHVYDFVEGYQPSITSPFGTSEIFSAGAYAPWLGGDTGSCTGDIADDFGTPGADGMISFGDFLALLGLVGDCPGMVPGCTGDIADDFGTTGADGMVSFGDFLALLGLVGPCP